MFFFLLLFLRLVLRFFHRPAATITTTNVTTTTTRYYYYYPDRTYPFLMSTVSLNFTIQCCRNSIIPYTVLYFNIILRAVLRCGIIRSELSEREPIS